MQLSTALGNSICDQFHVDGVVCPANLRHGIFTTAAVDNIDHNPSSTTAQGSLHGTAISLFQHPSSIDEGEERPNTPFDITATKREGLKPLPVSYTAVPPVVLPQEPAQIPQINSPKMSDGSKIANAMNLEYRYFLYLVQLT